MMYTLTNERLIKEIGLDCGLVQSIFRPCAETLVRLLDESLGASTEPIRIMDVGCGSGIIGRVIADCDFMPPRTIEALDGFDRENAAVEVATIKTIDDNRFKFWQGDATAPVPGGGGI